MRKTYTNSKLSDIINGNPYVLLLLQHFGIEDALEEKSVEEICNIYNIPVNLFASFLNLYNRDGLTSINSLTTNDLRIIISFLRRSHNYYIKEMFPKIGKSVRKLNKSSDKKIAIELDKFFNEYYDEVIKHLDYEDKKAFPYIKYLLDKKHLVSNYNIKDYHKNHNDIEEKLNDLKNLLLKYYPSYKEYRIKKDLLFDLFELEFDLNVHSKIEDLILIPLVEKLENDLT